jgi:hypothetical protein
MSERSDEDLLTELRAVDVPEPSPLFWDHFSARVREAIDEEPAPSRRSAMWPRLAWAGALAAVVVAAVITSGRVSHPFSDSGRVSAPVADAAVTAAPTLDDASWSVVASAVGDLDVDQASAAGLLPSPGTVDAAINQLPPDEQRQLVELLREEIKNSKPL